MSPGQPVVECIKSRDKERGRHSITSHWQPRTSSRLLGCLRCHAPLQLLLLSSRHFSSSFHISFLSYHVPPPLTPPHLYSRPCVPFYPCLPSPPLPTYYVSCIDDYRLLPTRPAMLCHFIRSVKRWPRTLSLFFSQRLFTKSYTAPAVPLSLITLAHPHPLPQPASRQVPFIFLSSSLSVSHSTLSFLCLSISFFLPAPIVLLHYQTLSQRPPLCHPGYL